MIGNMDRQRATVAPPPRTPAVRPSIVCHTQGHAIRDRTGRETIRRDEQERASAATYNRPHAVEQGGGGQSASIPDDQREGIAAQGETEQLPKMTLIVGPHPQKMRQMHPGGSGGRGMETSVGIEQENGM